MSNKVLFALVLTIGLALSGFVLSYHKSPENHANLSGMIPGIVMDRASISFRNPLRIAMDDEGKLYVSDYSNRFVATLNPDDLRVMRAFQVEGKPLGVAWGRGRIYVGNETASRVEIYTPGGNLQGVLDAEVSNPTDIAFDGIGGLVFVLDGREKTVLVFDDRGAFINAIPATGEAQEGLVAPTALAVDPSRGEVLVSDYGNALGRIPAAVKVYGYDGMFRFKVNGDAVQSAYRFSRPQGVYAGAGGSIYVADSVLSKVMAFDRNTLQGIASMGGFGTGEGELMLPLDIVIAPGTGDLFVTDNRNARVSVFRAGGLR